MNSMGVVQSAKHVELVREESGSNSIEYIFGLWGGTMSF